MFSLEFLGFTLGTAGKILVAFTAIRVHHRFLMEHKVDKKVLAEMKLEQVIGVLGVVLILVGYFFEVPTRISL